MKALVLGIGNILMRDDGLGVKAVELLKRRYDLPTTVVCVDGGVGGAALTGLFAGKTHAIVVDALYSKQPPGTVIRLDGDGLKGRTGPAIGAHGIGVAELLEIVRFEGHDVRLIVIGAVPMDVSPGLKLSAGIEAALPSIVSAIIKELGSFGIKIKRRS